MGTDRERSVRGGKGRGGSFTRGVNPFAAERSVECGAKIADVPDGASTVDSVLDNGLAVIFGRTKDGGAVSITLLDGDERHRT